MTMKLMWLLLHLLPKRKNDPMYTERDKTSTSKKPCTRMIKKEKKWWISRSCQCFSSFCYFLIILQVFLLVSILFLLSFGFFKIRDFHSWIIFLHVPKDNLLMSPNANKRILKKKGIWLAVNIVVKDIDHNIDIA